MKLILKICSLVFLSILHGEELILYDNVLQQIMG